MGKKKKKEEKKTNEEAVKEGIMLYNRHHLFGNIYSGRLILTAGRNREKYPPDP